MSDHLIAEANRHAQALPKMQLPTTQPTHSEIAWYVEECVDLKKQLASLERENAALRAALIDAAEKCDAITDAAIDAARKEQQ